MQSRIHHSVKTKCVDAVGATFSSVYPALIVAEVVLRAFRTQQVKNIRRGKGDDDG